MFPNRAESYPWEGQRGGKTQVAKKPVRTVF